MQPSAGSPLSPGGGASGPAVVLALTSSPTGPGRSIPEAGVTRRLPAKLGREFALPAAFSSPIVSVTLCSLYPLPQEQNADARQ